MSVPVLVIVFLVMLAGAAGTILPLLPGVPLVFLAALGYGIYDGFKVITPGFVALLGLLTLLALAMDWVGGVLVSRYTGASRAGQWGSVVGTVAGVLALGPWGLLLGPWVGGMVGELLAGASPGRAIRTGTASLLGTLGGGLAKFLLALTMVALFAWRVF